MAASHVMANQPVERTRLRRGAHRQRSPGAVHALQDAIKVEQKAVGKFEVPDWDQASLKRVREALLALAAASGGIDLARMFGRRGEVDPVQHLIGTAAGWGGNPLCRPILSAPPSPSGYA